MTASLLNGRESNSERLNHLITYLKMIIFGKNDHHIIYILFSNEVYKLAREGRMVSLKLSPSSALASSDLIPFKKDTN